MKNKKRGFTLVELLAVLILLGVVSVIAIPSIGKVLERSRQRAKEAVVNELIQASRKWSSENLKELPENDGESICKTVDFLVKTPHIKGEDVIDPTTDTPLSGGVKITFSEKFNNYNYEYSTDCSAPGVTDYVEATLNGTDPVLDQGMIPVIIENNGTVKKADVSKKWYSYSNKEWANVVLVNSSVRDNYKKASAGTTIMTGDILAYLVWIPRYKYKIPTSGTSTPSTIDIKFENKSTSKTIGDGKTTYYSHPAFTFGTNELNGIWVGKFETTGNTTTPTILPNITSLRNINIKTMFDTSRKFTSETYGVTSDAHMMKSSEWGSAVYLSHSNYGINNEVRINNNNGYITGCGAIVANGPASGSCEIAYGSNISNYPQSTTGNITGIFDMSGGAWEYVMSNYNKLKGDSGFSEGLIEIAAKYYDYFNTTTSSTACSGVCYGYALSETASWYSNYPNLISSNSPWYARGGCNFNGTNAGVFGSGGSAGSVSSNDSFRLTFSPGA